MRTSQFIGMALLGLFLTTGCTPVENEDTPGGTGSTESPSTTPDTEGSPLYLHLEAKYEGLETFSTVDSCIIPAGSAVGTSKTCEFVVPELQLFYSDLRITVGTNSSTTCKAVFFHPYAYKRASSATFQAYGNDTEFDCSSFWPTDKECWGGAALGFMPTDFPENGGRYFMTETQLTASYTADSINTLRGENSDDPSFYTNVIYASDLLDTATMISNGTIQYAGTAGGASRIRPYSVSCADEFADDLYEVIMNINDEDGTDGDDQFGWN